MDQENLKSILSKWFTLRGYFLSSYTVWLSECNYQCLIAPSLPSIFSNRLLLQLQYCKFKIHFQPCVEWADCAKIHFQFSLVLNYCSIWQIFPDRKQMDCLWMPVCTWKKTHSYSVNPLLYILWFLLLTISLLPSSTGQLIFYCSAYLRVLLFHTISNWLPV